MDRQYSSLALNRWSRELQTICVHLAKLLKLIPRPMLSGGIREQRTGNLSREHLEIWLKGQNQLSKPEMWPAVVQTKPSKETEAEAKLVKDLFPGATEMKETLHKV